MRRSLCAIAGFAFLLAGSSPSRADDIISFGSVVGAGLGALTGNQIGHGTGKIAATAVGAFTGGVIGHHVQRTWHGNSDDGYDGGGLPSYSYYEPAPVVYSQNYVAPPAPPASIIYAEPRYVYSDPQPVYETSYAGSEGHCREFTQRIQIGDQMQDSYGTACLQPDGSWRIVP